jgi:hypothetical protein
MNRRLGKILFPRLPPDLQRRKTNTFLAVLLVLLLLVSAIALIMVLGNKTGAH